MKTFSILFIGIPVILASFSAYSQVSNYDIKGVILDSAKHTSLVSATVYVKNPKDSAIIALGFTDEKGAFLLKGIPRNQEVQFSIFYTGYAHYHQVLKNVTKDVLDFGNIYLSLNANTLNTVTITGEKPPIAIKGDTIEFNASSFKTRPNSVLSDLLKKLPGVDVDQNGNVTANGKTVDKIMVDGKKFFGDDPKIALQNLPSAIVDKVQITDTKTREEELTGQPAGGNTKTINITLKKGKDHGVFGRAYAGYGTGKHYDASALINYFEGKRQISLLGAVNNINQVGFTMGEMVNMMGRDNVHMLSVNRSTGSFGINGINFGGSDEGLKRTTTAGINYNDSYGKHFSVNGSYFYGDVKLDNETQTARQNILPDSLSYYHSDNAIHSDNLNHRVNATINFKDSLWHIYYEPSVSVSNSKGVNQSTAVSTGAKGEKVNESSSLYTNDDQTSQLINRLNIYRTFKKKEQFLYFYFRSNNQSVNGNDYNSYRNLYYNGATADDSANQHIDNQARNNQYNARLSYSQPFSKAISMNIGYELNWQYALTDKKTYDFNDATQKYTEPDTAYSNKFRSNTITQTPRAGLSFSLDSGIWRIITSADFNFIGLHHYSFTHDIGYNRNEFFISPNINVTHRTKKHAYLSFQYSSYIRQPDISQLLPVADNTNPLYIVKGNPNLKPSLNRNLWLNYNKFDVKSGNNIWLGVGYNASKNAIASVTIYDNQLRQLTTYTNVDGNKSLNLNVDLSKTKKEKDYHWQIKLGSYSTFNNNHAFVNDVPYTSKSYNIMLHPSVTYGYKELFEFIPSYQLRYQYSKYDIKALDNRQGIMQQGELSGTLYWPGRVTWESDWSYTHNSEVAPGFRKAFWLWNASVSVDLFKKKQGSLQFSVYDLLNQNISVKRNITDTYIEDTQTIILHRYFMLKFIYNLSKFGEKKKKENMGPFFFF